MTTNTTPMEAITFKTKSIYWEPNHFNNVLVQNNNGPCFLISLVNSLILSQELVDGGTAASDEGWITVNNKKSKTPSVVKDDINEELLSRKPKITHDLLIPLKTLLSRSDVWLTDLLSELTNLLLNLYDDTEDLTPILNGLSVLHTGLSINPDFHQGIVDTKKNPVIDISEKLGLKVIHGWLLDPKDKPELINDINDYDSLIDLKLQLIDKINRIESNETLASQDEFLLESLFSTVSSVRKESEKLEIINRFLEENATELTSYGLSQLKETDSIIKSGEMCIFFRNNHFNTIYKREHDLYLLLIDEGFKSNKSFNEAMVWESLTSINGSSDVLLDGNFHLVQPFEQNPFGSDLPDKKIDYNDYVMDDNENGVLGTLDELLALSLQQQEDEKLAKSLQKQYDKSETENAKRQQQRKKNKKKTKATAIPAIPQNDKNKNKTLVKEDNNNCVIM